MFVRIGCDEPGCPQTVADHYWGKVKADGWFFAKDGRAYCPEHEPAWVAEWRARRQIKES